MSIYYETAEAITISRQRALVELANHGATDGATIASFLADVGDNERYNAQAVLVWLGY